MKRFVGILSVIWLLLVGSIVFAATTITLTWTPNTETDLAGYKVYRGTGTCSTGPLQPLMVNNLPVSLGKVSTYKDTTVPTTEGLLVCYEITAFDTSNNESLRSNRATKVLNVVPPVAPIGLTITDVIAVP